MEADMLKILLKLKDKELKTLETDKAEITIGRNENSDICINNLGASNKHARIFQRNGQYIIEDLKSTNGTLVNGETTITAKLSGNEVVTIGKHNLYISIQDGQNATANPAESLVEATIKIGP
jgi:pSer/pThr/pTyr-binding forkhead associated (FHA) protein